MNTKSTEWSCHALGSSEIWDRMVNVIYFCMNWQMYMYVVVLDQNTPVAGKTILGPELEEGGRGTPKFSVSFKAEKENFQSSLGGNICLFNIRFQFQEPPPPGGNRWYFPISWRLVYVQKMFLVIYLFENFFLKLLILINVWFILDKKTQINSVV